MTRWNRTTELAQSIDDILAGGTGNLTPTIDDITLVHKARLGLSIAEAVAQVNRSLDTALRYLDEERGWTWVKVTQQYEAYRGQPEPEDRRAVAGCVAGRGRAAKTHAVHFHVDGDRVCWFWFWARDMGIRSGEGKTSAQIGRVDRSLDSGAQPTEAAGELALVASQEVRHREDVQRLAAKHAVALPALKGIVK